MSAGYPVEDADSVDVDGPTQADARKGFLRGAAAGLPIVIGYLPIAVTFGVIAQQAGLPLYQTFLMSLLVFAGASQFMAVNMLAAGAGGLEVVTATFVLNFRHFVMNLSLMDLLSYLPKGWRLVLSSWVTDETFAMASFQAKSQRLGHFHLAGLLLAAYGSWVGGSVTGALLAGAIPPTISESLSIALYAMFIGLLVPAVRGAWRAGAVAGISMLLCGMFSRWLESGWSIVLATILGGVAGSFLMREDET